MIKHLCGLCMYSWLTSSSRVFKIQRRTGVTEVCDTCGPTYGKALARYVVEELT